MLDRSSSYYQQVSLLVSILLLVETENCFALKGGTAINLFFQDLPRLAVDISEQVEEQFSYTSMQLLDWHEVYAGKLCAALDRQHPRDLFDVMVLLEQEGITAKLIDLFIVYLISGNRPISEMLAPRMVSIEAAFNDQFKGMSFKDITLNELEKTRIQLVELINCQLTDEHKQFLLSFKSMQPDWSLLGLDGSELPAVKWKLLNLNKMSKQKHQAALDKLEAVLYGDNHV